MGATLLGSLNAVLAMLKTETHRITTDYGDKYNFLKISIFFCLSLHFPGKMLLEKNKQKTKRSKKKKKKPKIKRPGLQVKCIFWC